MNKSQLRHYFRERRCGIAADVRRKAAYSVCEFLIEQPIFKNSHSIACYLATPSELDTQPIIEAIWKAGKKCYLPVLTNNESLEFVFCDKETELVLNEFDIYEPKNKSKKIAIDELNLVLVPLVAFDLQGHRLGAGGGYYDRTFAGCKQRPPLVGLGFGVQEADVLPVDEWDVKLNAIITEAGVVFI